MQGGRHELHYRFWSNPSTGGGRRVRMLARACHCDDGMGSFQQQCATITLYSTLALAPHQGTPAHFACLPPAMSDSLHPLSLTQDVRAGAYRGAAEARASQAW